MVTPDLQYALKYPGRTGPSVTVRLDVAPGTTEALTQIGVRNGADVAAVKYPLMPKVGSVPNWSETSAFFKGEGP
jgi:hypothetical protein